MRNTQRQIIYIITNGKHIKLGLTSGIDATKRLKELQTGSSEKLTLLYQAFCPDRVSAFALESALHQYFAGRRIRNNNEWFNVPPQEVVKLLEFLEATKSAYIETADPTESYYKMNPDELHNKNIKRTLQKNTVSRSTNKQTKPRTRPNSQKVATQVKSTKQPKRAQTRPSKKQGSFLEGFLSVWKK